MRIVDGVFLSYWDDGATCIRSKCKVNLDTKEVFDIETADVSDFDLDVLDFEEVELDGQYRYIVNLYEELTEEEMKKYFWHK